MLADKQKQNKWKKLKLVFDVLKTKTRHKAIYQLERTFVSVLKLHAINLNFVIFRIIMKMAISVCNNESS